jgi:phytoene dehydrogenase-like protein
MNERYDIAIVGGGHNGLTAAFYLARAGLRTIVLERREIVGGACVTEEIAPGVRASTTSYIASMLRPEIVADLGLAERGLRMVPCEPGLQVVFEDARCCRGGRRTNAQRRRSGGSRPSTRMRSAA